MAAMFAASAHTPLLNSVADPSQHVSTPPTVAVPSPAAADGQQPSQPPPAPPSNGPAAGSSGLDTPDSVWAALETQAPPANSTAALANVVAAITQAPPAAVTPPPAAPAPAVPTPEPTTEAVPRPGELPKRRYQTQNEAENAAITAAQTSGKPLIEALASEYAARGLPLPAGQNFGFAPQAPAAPVAPAPAAPAPPPAPVVPPPGAEVTALRTRLTEINKELLQINTVTFNTVEGERLIDEQARLEAELDAARERAILAKQQQVQNQQTAAQQELDNYGRVYDAAVAEIMPAFQGLGVPGTPMQEAYAVEMQKAYDGNDVALLNPAEAPLIIANRARKALGQSLSLPPVSSPQPPASRPPVSFPGILPGAGNGTSTAPPAPTELPLDKLRASFYAFKEKVTSGSKSDGLDDYRS